MNEARHPPIASSAYKHSIATEDLRHAFRNPIRAYDLEDSFTMLVGPAKDGELLEIGVVTGDDGPVIVHGMRARSRFLSPGVT